MHIADRRVDLAVLLARIPSVRIDGPVAKPILALAIDSRAVTPGTLFVALRGTLDDGHDYVGQAIANGAVAVVVERPGAASVAAEGVTTIVVEDSRRALSAVSAAFYGDPSHALDVVGVTGTNGKTTTTRMIAAIFDAARRPCGVIGTVGAAFGERVWPLANTTPLPPELHGLLAAMRDDGAKAVAMEVSSHALALDRVADVRFRAAALTNVTRDHLDFHGTIEAYASAKERLFTMAQSSVLNAGDAFGQRWYAAASARGPVLTYAMRGGADIVPSDLVVDASGSRFFVDATAFSIRLPGRFNVENALAAVGVARLCGIDDATSARGLAQLERVPGRMEHVGGAVDVVVDYSHTPDSLERALRSLRETVRGRLAVVFGCGGDRDRGKRPQMGAVAAEFADRIYVTSDNPRTEDPDAIVAEIVPGIGAHDYVVEVDRRRAIERAIREARDGDVVLIAGKGHEAYQIVGDRVLPFDDAQIARETLQALENRA